MHRTDAMLGRPMANPYIKQYLMTAGPTPLPPAVSQVMAEPMLYHRAPAFVEVYARVLERLKLVFQTRNEVLVFAASGTGAMESAVANLTRARRARARRLVREVRRALAGALRGLRRGGGAPRRRLGQQGGAGGPRPRALRQSRGRSRLHHPVGDLDRRGQRRSRAHRGRPPPRGADRRRRRLRAGGRSVSTGRVGRRRGRRGLAEGADVAAGARLRVAQRGGAGARRRAARRAATTSTGSARSTDSGPTRRTARSRPPSGSSRRSTWRSGSSSRRAWSRSSAAMGCWAGRRGRPPRRSTSSCSARRTTARTS